MFTHHYIFRVIANIILKEYSVFGHSRNPDNIGGGDVERMQLVIGISARVKIPLDNMINPPILLLGTKKTRRCDMRLYDLIREIEARGEGWVLDDGADLWDTDSLLDDLLSDDDGVVALEQEAVWVPIDDAGTGSIVTLNPDGYQGRTLYRVRRLQ